MRRSRLALTLALLLLARAAAAQEPPGLDHAVQRIAAAWARGDSRALGEAFAQAGVSLDVGYERAGPLGSRKTVAVLRRIFEERETVAVRTGMAEIVGGSPPRAFVELAWASRVRGTDIRERTIVFLALVREEETWRITGIRLLP